MRPFALRALSTLRPVGDCKRARKPDVRARARRVPWSVFPMLLPPATTTSAPRPCVVGVRSATARNGVGAVG